jgi:hypothetical protein
VSVKVFDFGLAVMHEHDTLTAVGDIPGTLAYISPERLRGEQAGPAADVWAVGVLLWEALAGRHPFWGGSLLETAKRIDGGAPPLATVRPDLGRAVAECVDRALSLDPARRPSAATLAGRLRQAAARARAPRPRGTRPRLRPGPAVRRTAPAVAAVLFAAWSASALTFFPAGWALGIAAVAGALTALNQRAGLAFCLAVPVLPLGNYSLGLALAYALAAVVWFVLSWREPGGGLFLTIGPVLASAGLLVALPLAGLAIRHPLRRGLQVAAAVLAAAAVAGASRLDALGIAASESPKAAVVAVADAVGRITVVEAVTLAVVAVLLPFARQRGPWAAAGLGAFMIAAPLLAAPALPAAPTVVAAWMACIGLLTEPHVRARLRARHEPPTEETVVVQALRPVQETPGGG